MNRILRKSHDEGLTLVEILASIVILSMLIISFLALFLNSAKSINKTEVIIDSTYVVQTKMEEIYGISQTYNFSNSLSRYSGLDWSEIASNQPLTKITMIQNNDYFITAEITKNVNSPNLVTVLIKAYNNESKQHLETQMETILLWRE
jgi:type II secretory pathway pseudopilin PulG